MPDPADRRRELRHVEWLTRAASDLQLPREAATVNRRDFFENLLASKDHVDIPACGYARQARRRTTSNSTSVPSRRLAMLRRSL